MCVCVQSICFWADEIHESGKGSNLLRRVYVRIGMLFNTIQIFEYMGMEYILKLKVALQKAEYNTIISLADHK